MLDARYLDETSVWLSYLKVDMDTKIYNRYGYWVVLGLVYRQCLTVYFAVNGKILIGLHLC